jgi:glycolate oxidase
MMDKPAIDATEAFCHPGYPMDAGAILIVELDGHAAEVDELVDRVAAIARDGGATTVRTSADEDERLLFWKGRKSAFPAVGRITPDYLCMDGTIPRARVAEVLERMAGLAAARGLRVANVFHAGDGNLHPLILFDANQAGELEKAEDFGRRILEACVAAGGTVTGEHGVGVEKLDAMCSQFAAPELEQFHRVKAAFDPAGLLNPGKAIPTLHRCAEMGRMHVHGGQLPHPELPRF